MIGQTIGSYKVLSRIGEGGMGTVYRGLDLMLDRPVALKALRADLAGSADLVERFRLEARAVARLHHPNVGSVYALHREGDHFYLVMEFIEGETLEARLRRVGRLHPAEGVPLMAQALAGLGHAHAQGVVHRDIKPANLMITPQGTVKIMDFGIARVLGGQRMTRTRFAVGTAEYMAPEQVRGGEVDGRTDLYALGIVLYEALTGQVPFRSDSEFELMRAQVEEAPPRLRSRLTDVPEALDDALDRALAKAPADRFADANAFREALLAVALPDKPTAPPTRLHTPAPGTPFQAAATRVVTPGEQARATAPVAATRLAVPGDFGSPGSTAAPATMPEASPVGLWHRPAVWGSAVAGLGMLVVLAFSLTRLAGSAPSPPPAPVQAEATEPLDFARQAQAALQAQDPPSGQPGTALSSPPGSVATAMLLASAERFFARDHLTSPRDSNALDVTARVLAAEPGNGQARGLVRRIVERYQGWGAAQEQRQRYAQALRYYQTALGVANRFPSVAGDLAAPLHGAVRSATARGASPSASGTTDGAAEPARRTPEPPAEAPADTPTGAVRIVVRPYGSVFIDGRRVATDTFDAVELTLPVGVHTVRAVHPTLGSTERRVTIRPGATEDVLIRLSN